MYSVVHCISHPFLVIFALLSLLFLFTGRCFGSFLCNLTSTLYFTSRNLLLYSVRRFSFWTIILGLQSLLFLFTGQCFGFELFIVLHRINRY